MENFNDQFTKPKHNIFLYVVVIVVVLGVGYLGVSVYRATQQKSSDILASLSDKYINELSVDSSGVGAGNAQADVETEDDPFIGSRDGRVHIVEFGDFECPFCSQEVAVIQQLEARYGNQIFMQFRNFPIVTLHPNAYNAALAAECAYAQGNEKFWQYHDRLYQFQDSLSDDLYFSLAQRTGLDVDAFTTCYNQKTPADEVEQDYLDGVDLGVTGTPTFFINGHRVPGAISFDMFQKVIDQLLEKSS